MLHEPVSETVFEVVDLESDDPQGHAKEKSPCSSQTVPSVDPYHEQLR